MLGEFEYLLITVAAGLGDNSYGASIREELALTTGRRCSLGALYTTIDRLETKGLLQTWMGDATPRRGGRSKRMVRVTPMGERAAKEFYDTVSRVSRNASWAMQPNREHRMTRVGSSFVAIAAQMLQRDEREAALGDLVEASEGAWQGLADVLSLVLYRQAILWKSWRPWLAGLGLTVPNSFLLMGASVSLSQSFRTAHPPQLS